MSNAPESPLQEVTDPELARIIGKFVLDAVIIAGTDSRIIYWNASAERLFGLPRDQVVGRNMHDIITPERYREKAKQGFAHFAETGSGPLLGRVVRIEALREDGTEFPVELSVSPIELKGRRCAVAILRDDTLRRGLEEEQLRLARTDPLTGILNRRAFFEEAEEELKRGRRYPGGACLVVVDLDRFKAVNDRYGHAAGDLVLMAFCARAAVCLRETDSFGRLGGEEFGLLLPETDAEGGRVIAERLREEVEKSSIPHEGGEIRITVSAGVASWNSSSESVGDAMKRADAAVYRAKDEGRNRVVVAEAKNA